MPSTPIQIEMWWKKFQIFFPNFCYYFPLKKGICNRTFLLFLCSHLCENFPPKIWWLIKTPQKIQGIKSSTDSYMMARNNIIITHLHLLWYILWFTLTPRHLLTYCSPRLKSKNGQPRSKQLKYCSHFGPSFHSQRTPHPPPPLHSLFRLVKAVPMPEKSVINMIWVLLPVSVIA